MDELTKEYHELLLCSQIIFNQPTTYKKSIDYKSRTITFQKNTRAIFRLLKLSY